MFASEREMSVLFEQFVRSAFGNAYLKEFPGLFGVPDFICYAKDRNSLSIVSFELKLANWKRAAKQAFRHKSFANIVYVVLDSQQATAVMNHLYLFKQYNIGLAFFDKSKHFSIIYKPAIAEPYSRDLHQKIRHSVAKCRKKIRNIETLAA